MGSLYQPGMFLSSKKRKDKSVTFRLENKVLESLAAYLYNQTEGSRGHTHRDLLVQENTQRPPQEYCQRLYLCPMLCCRPGLGRDDRPKSCVWGALRAYLTLKPFTGVCLGLPVMLGPMFGLPDP